MDFDPNTLPSLVQPIGFFISRDASERNVVQSNVFKSSSRLWSLWDRPDN